MKNKKMDRTARLAVIFGMILLNADILAQTPQFDARTAREISILSRVLEKRLSETRRLIMKSAENERIADDTTIEGDSIESISEGVI